MVKNFILLFLIINFSSSHLLRRKRHQVNEIVVPFHFHCTTNGILPVYEFEIIKNNTLGCTEERIEIEYSTTRNATQKHTGFIANENGCVYQEQKLSKGDKCAKFKKFQYGDNIFLRIDGDIFHTKKNQINNLIKDYLWKTSDYPKYFMYIFNYYDTEENEIYVFTFIKDLILSLASGVMLFFFSKNFSYYYSLLMSMLQKEARSPRKGRIYGNQSSRRRDRSPSYERSSREPSPQRSIDKFNEKNLDNVRESSKQIDEEMLNKMIEFFSENIDNKSKNKTKYKRKNI